MWLLWARALRAILQEKLSTECHVFPRKPERLTYQQAAAIPMSALTAWQALFDTAGLQAGQTVFIPGGAGGVGHFAIQLAKWKGAYVIATTSTRNVAFVREL